MVELTKLREIRREKRINIQSLANDTGLDRDTISKIERGLGRPSFESVVKIVEGLGYRLEILI